MILYLLGSDLQPEADLLFQPPGHNHRTCLVTFQKRDSNLHSLEFFQSSYRAEPLTWNRLTDTCHLVLVTFQNGNSNLPSPEFSEFLSC